MKKVARIIVLILLGILYGYVCYATPPRDVYTTTSGGSWVNVLNWDLGVPDNDQTDGNDDIIITHHITLTDDLTVKSGTNITITGCDTLHVTGNVTFNNGSAILVEPCAVLIIDGNLTNNNNSVDVQINGKVIIAGDYDGGNGSELTGTGEMEVDGEVTTDGDGTVFGSEEDCTVDCDNSNDDPLGDPLPIELIFFNAIAEDDNVRLEWLTATEINNDFFEIHKSTDGITWQVIGTIKGSGNSNTPLMYNFIDNTPTQGHNYYQLYQIDYDGTLHKKKLAYIHIGEVIPTKNIAIYPNPAIQEEDINVKLIGFSGEEVLIVVMDVLGNIYYEKAVVTLTNNQIVIINSELSSGTYIVVGSSKQELYKRKLVIK
jgi:hypothetical protein